jgi:hypothetical protein
MKSIEKNMPVVKLALEKSETLSWENVRIFCVVLAATFLFLWGMFSLVSEYSHIQVNVEIGKQP